MRAAGVKQRPPRLGYARRVVGRTNGVAVTLLAWMLAGCGACGGAGESRPSSAAPAAASEEHTATPPAEAKPAPPKVPPPALAVQTHLDDDAHVQWSLQNRDRDRVRVAAAVRLEREAGQGFEPFAELSLRDDCEKSPPTCRELVAGAELQPPPWLATGGAAQCTCEGCPPAPPGRYRMVLAGCDGEYELPTAPFELAR